MNHFRIALVCVGFLAAGVTAQEPGPKEPGNEVGNPSRQQIMDLLEGRLEKKDLRKLLNSLAVGVTQHAHPTAINADLVNFRLSASPAGLIQLVMSVEYFGGFTGRRYAATIYLTLDRSDPNETLITRLDFADATNRIPPNRQNLSLLKRKLNQVLAD